MISSEKEYLEAMRDMIRKVQNGYEPPFSADAEELEIFADCIRQGYLLGRTTYVDKDGNEQELRTLDGKMHPELINHVVPPKGLAFLNPSGTAEQRIESMKKVLLRIQSQEPFENLSFEEQRIFKECYDAGYIEGVVPLEMISGRIVAEYRQDPRLTLKGLQFIDGVNPDKNSKKNNDCNEPDETHPAKGQSDTGEQALKWTKAGVIATVVIGIMGFIVAYLIAKFV